MSEDRHVTRPQIVTRGAAPELEYAPKGTTAELATLKRQRDMLLEALKKLVSGLNNTTWSTWQTNARFADEWQKAEDVIAAVEGEK